MSDPTGGLSAGQLAEQLNAAEAKVEQIKSEIADENERIRRINHEMEEAGEEPVTSMSERLAELEPQLDQAHDRVFKLRKALEAATGNFTVVPPPAAAAPDLFQTVAHPPPEAAPEDSAGESVDTGHYDDGHSFGWKADEPPAANWTNLTGSTTADEPPPGDWKNLTGPPPPSSGRKPYLVGAAVIVALLLIGLGLFLWLGGSSGDSNDAATTPTDATTHADESAPTSQAVATGDRPISYSSTCNGPACNAYNSGTCTLTYHMQITFTFPDGKSHDGEIAVIKTLGPGWSPSYDVPVANGALDKTLTAHHCLTSGETSNWRAVVTSVGGKPTITPNAPS